VDRRASAGLAAAASPCKDDGASLRKAGLLPLGAPGCGVFPGEGRCVGSGALGQLDDVAGRRCSAAQAGRACPAAGSRRGEATGSEPNGRPGPAESEVGRPAGEAARSIDGAWDAGHRPVEGEREYRRGSRGAAAPRRPPDCARCFEGEDRSSNLCVGEHSMRRGGLRSRSAGAGMLSALVGWRRRRGASWAHLPVCRKPRTAAAASAE
jgi:hypothetical protein